MLQELFPVILTIVDGIFLAVQGHYITSPLLIYRDFLRYLLNIFTSHGGKKVEG
jgi:hypothetical protein